MQALSLDKICDIFSATLLGSILCITIIVLVKIYDVLETGSCSFPGGSDTFSNPQFVLNWFCILYEKTLSSGIRSIIFVVIRMHSSYWKQTYNTNNIWTYIIMIWKKGVWIQKFYHKLLEIHKDSANRHCP